MGRLWPWQHVHKGCLDLGCLPFGMLFSLMRVFSKRIFFFFFSLEEGYMGKLAFLSLGSVLTRAPLAIAACL